MTTKLQQAFKRELDLNGDKYTLTVTPEGFKLVVKGKRKGVELSWASVVGGSSSKKSNWMSSSWGSMTRSNLPGYSVGAGIVLCEE